jgi:hypothetical protein
MRLRKLFAASAIHAARARTRGNAAVGGVTQLCRGARVREREEAHRADAEQEGGATASRTDADTEPCSTMTRRRSATCLVDVEAVEARREAGDRPGDGGA